MSIVFSRETIAAIVFACSLSAADTPFAWKSVNLQGMGYVTGLVIHPKAPNDIYIRTDVGGAYRFDRGARRWLPLSDRSDLRAAGFEAIAVDPTDANTVYGSAGVTTGTNTYAEVFVSHSRGAYWQPTGLASAKLYLGANDPYRGTTGERIAVDPARPQRIFLGTRKDGLWVKDGEQGWSQVPGIPTSAPDTSGVSAGVTFVICDQRLKRVYAGVWGSGVWMSEDGGSAWTNIAKQVNPARAAVASDGTLVATFGGDEGGRGGSVQRFRSGAWKEITPLSTYDAFAGVSFSAVNPRELVVCAGHDQLIYRSSDQGDTWSKLDITGATNQPPYYNINASGANTAKAAGWGNGTVTIDPVQPKRLLQTNGYGVIATEDYTATGTTWQWWMNNLEELVVQGVKVPPLDGGADLISVAMDMVGFRHASRDAVPLETAAKFDWVAQGNSIAYSAQHPEYIAIVGWDETNVSRAMTAYSSDNGKTWAPFTSTSPGVGGNIAMSSTDPENLVWIPTRNAAPAYSIDGGKSWKKCGTIPPSWQVSNEWWAAQVVAADPFEGGTFYYYSQGDIYATSDRGATWTKLTTVSNVAYTIKVSLIANPAKPGELWLAHKHNDNQSPFPLYRSTDGGKKFNAVPGIDACNFVAFGKGNSPDTPFVYIHGRTSGAAEEAVYKSEDMGATWKKISDPSQQAFGSINALEGDMRTKDLVYAGTGGRGIFYGYGPGSSIPAPSLRAEDVKNGAGYQAGMVAPGEIVTFWGSGIGPGDAAAAQLDEGGFISTSTGGTQVFFDGFPAPLIYASSGQSSAVAPYGLAGRSTTEMQVAYNGALSPPVTLPVVASMPAIFTRDSTGQGFAVAVNYSGGQLNSAANPVKRGEYVIFYVTGDGQTNPGGLDGWPVSGTPPRTAQEVSATVGGSPAHVDYAGGAPTFVMGVAQFNVQVPADAPAGPAVALSVTVGGTSSPAGVTIAVE
jgi:xyloglucan-specific exo-beta-1,4-glucanase